LLENALHHTGADAKFPADLEDAVAIGRLFEYSRVQGSTASIIQQHSRSKLVRDIKEKRAEYMG
jgi:hypothetical protein